MSIIEDSKKMKIDSPFLAATSNELRNESLKKIAENLKNNAALIFEQNAIDLANAEKNNVSAAVMKRLKFNEAKLSDCINGINQLISLEDPLHKITLKRELDKDLILERHTCPIGVIGVIFEARPDALIQISTLCIKSGNCAILKGGKETANTNRILFTIIYDSIIEAGLPDNSLRLAESHSEIDELLSCDKYVDLIIPRGSNAFVQYIMNNTKIPVMGHADGICHIYVDDTFNKDIAISVIKDAKTQYTAACNSVETLLINRKIAASFLPELSKAMRECGVSLFGTKEVCDIINSSPLKDEGFIEYLDLCASVKLVDSVDEAIEHINSFGSHHTDSIITDNIDNANRFKELVDSAGVYHNCSTRFADGFRYGFGAEVGISTGKIHARGPVGLEGLITYKYTLSGKGHIVDDYATGNKQFHFKDL